jgi:hypothetical protein
MTKGVIVGCDRHQEWLLEWWWSHYTQHNKYPVAFVDLGMSSQAQSWCKSKGHYISLEAPQNFVFPKSLISPELVLEWENTYGRELWHGREKWFYKPYALQQTPFDEAIWVDLDCEVTGSLTPIFQKIHTHSKMTLAKEHGLNEEETYNSGVIGYHRDSPLLALWTELCFHHNDRFLGDQDVLSFIINSENVEVAELPNKYNWVIRNGINCDAVVLHWAGKWGKEVIRRQCD